MGPAAAIWLKGSSDRFSLLDSQLRHTGGNGLGVQRSDAVEVSGTVFEDMGFSGMELQGQQYLCCYPMGHKSTLQQEAETELGLLLQLMTIGESLEEEFRRYGTPLSLAIFRSQEA